MWPPPPPPAGTRGTRGRILALPTPSARPSPPPHPPASPLPPLLTGKQQSGYQLGGCGVRGLPGRRACGSCGGRSGLLSRPRRLARPRLWVSFAPTGSTGRAVPARKPEPARREGRARRSRGLARPGPPASRRAEVRGLPGATHTPLPLRAALPAAPRAPLLHLPGLWASTARPGSAPRLSERQLCYPAVWGLDPATLPSDNPFAGKWFYSGARSWGWGCRPG